MKEHSVQRGIYRNRSGRKAGDGPDLGRVGRMPGCGQPKKPRRGRGRKSDLEVHGDVRRLRRNRARRAIILGWSIGVGVVTAVALAGAFMFWLSRVLLRDRDNTAAMQAAADARARVVSKFSSPSEEAAVVLVKRVLALRDPAEVAAIVRCGSAKPEQVVAYMQGLEAANGPIVKDQGFRWMSSVDKNGMSLEGVEVVFEKDDKLKSRIALLTPDEKGVWKMDFAAFARTVEPSWGDLLDKAAPSAVVRVFATSEKYYNGPFRDEKQWRAYGLATPERDEILIGYCKVGSRQHKAMELMWSLGDVVVSRATLELRRVEGADGRQFEISHVLAEDWVVGEKPFEDRFK